MATRPENRALAVECWREKVPLAELCTFEVGGPARFFARCRGDDEIRGALAWAAEGGLPVFVLGGGSNVLFSDRGWPGLVLQPGDDGVELTDVGADTVVLRAGAAVPWDEVVRRAVEAGLAGVECLSGIPGSAGAAPIQNIGAYGQEVAETVYRVRALDRRTGESTEFTAEECGFGYRWSRFKGEWRDHFVVTGLDLRLKRSAVGAVRYGELRRRLEERLEGRPVQPSPGELRRLVLELRRSKSMVLDAGDPNRRSAGSFFLNPVVEPAAADAIAERARRRGVERELPRFPADGGVKLPAAWLIEEAGFSRGYGAGRAGLSSQHTLALINRGDADAKDLLDLAGELRRGVYEAFGVRLEPEPVFVGFGRDVEELLDV